MNPERAERLASQREEISALVFDSGLEIEALAEKVHFKPETFRKYANGYQPASERFMKTLRFVARSLQARDEPRFDARVAEDPKRVSRETKTRESGPRGRLAQALRNRGWTPAQLAQSIGYDTGIVENVVRGRGRISEEMAERIACEMPELEVEHLLEGSDDPPIHQEDGVEGTYGAKVRVKLPPGMTGRYVPILSGAEAGPLGASHSDASYEHGGVFVENLNDRTAFAIRVSGNSMEPAIDDGDMVVCSPKGEIADGEAAVVRTHSEQVFVKFWHRDGERVFLESANPAYKAIELPISEIAGAWPVVHRAVSGKIKKKG